MFTLQQLQYFVTVVEEQSFNRAAKQLFISQPALTKQMARLEQRVGCTLLIRNTTSIEPTEAGRMFYGEACTIVTQAEQTLSKMRDYAKKQPVRIGAPPSLANYYLPSLLPHINQMGYSYELTIHDTTKELVRMGEQRQLDILLVQDVEHENISLQSTLLFTEPYKILLPVTHPLTKQSELRIEEIAKEKLIFFKEPCGIRTSIRKQLIKWNIFLAPCSEMDDTGAIVTSVSQGDGISIVPNIIAENTHHPSVTVRKLHDPFYRSIYMLFSSSFQEFVQGVCEHLKHPS